MKGHDDTNLSVFLSHVSLALFMRLKPGSQYVMDNSPTCTGPSLVRFNAFSVDAESEWFTTCNFLASVTLNPRCHICITSQDSHCQLRLSTTLGRLAEKLSNCLNQSFVVLS